MKIVVVSAIATPPKVFFFSQNKGQLRVAVIWPCRLPTPLGRTCVGGLHLQIKMIAIIATISIIMMITIIAMRMAILMRLGNEERHGGIEGED